MPETNPSQPRATVKQTVGMVARWQPVHLGHQAVLRALCRSSAHVHIGIGSANEHNYRSPFSVDEVSEMLHLALGEWKNYTLHPIPDLHDGPRWRELVAKTFGPLDVFYTDNPYVANLMQERYRVARPVRLLDKSEQIAVSGTDVRRAMARGEDWQSLTPPEVCAYLTQHRLDDCFRQEFGLQTLALETIVTERSN